MRLYIPHLRDKLELTKAWTFNLHGEYRNNTLQKALGVSLRKGATITIPDPSGAVEQYEDYDYYAPKVPTQWRGYKGAMQTIMAAPKVMKTRRATIDIPNPYPDGLVPVTFPKGTILTVDRVFIRNGMPDFDSVTFRIAKDDKGLASIRTDGKKSGVRFWAKLPDVNTMNFNLVSLE